MNAATCSCTRRTTSGAALPTVVDRDAGAEVDQRVAVGVEEDAAAGGLDEHRQRGADAVGDVLLLAGELLAASAGRGSR